MNQQDHSNDNKNQPQIRTQAIDRIKKVSQQSQKQQNHASIPQIQNKASEKRNQIQFIKQLQKKHPQCIPIFYVKHEAAPSDFPSPKMPFILFKKQLKIQQAMFSLYNQIQITGLYFFCTRYNMKQQRMKYFVLKPGETVEQIYKKYGKDGYLTLIYGDKNIGMGSANKMEKWLIRILIVLGLIWAFLYAIPLYYIYEQGGAEAVWNTISLVRSNQETHPNYDNLQNNSHPVNQTAKLNDIYIQSQTSTENFGDQQVGNEEVLQVNKNQAWNNNLQGINIQSDL